ncbi:transglutaminase domain-containing protein [Longibacter salinarum]|uniref:transglutaminase domain-containing protein n=1 Tax=Longibacter salinarum TaxID=1850348 RepID=UPI0015CF7DCC|nr:transglutaminase domain-containing protein [Longibacter salinarum]
MTLLLLVPRSVAAQDTREQAVSMNPELTKAKTIEITHPDGVIDIPSYRSATYEQSVQRLSPDTVLVTVATKRASFDDPYPVVAVPDSMQRYAGPTANIQSDAADIAAIANQIRSQANARTQQELVNAVLRWNSNHLRWARPNEVPDALTALERGSGNCIAFTHLPAAVLRHLGIPARTARTFVARPDANALIRHYLLEVYYPSTGAWATYEPQIPGQPWTSNVYLYNAPDWSTAGQRRTRPISEDPRTTVRYARQAVDASIRAGATPLASKHDNDALYTAVDGDGPIAAVGRTRSPGDDISALLTSEAIVFEADATGTLIPTDTVGGRAAPETFWGFHAMDVKGTPVLLPNHRGSIDAHVDLGIAAGPALGRDAPYIFERSDDSWSSTRLTGPPSEELAATEQTVAIGPEAAVVVVPMDRDDRQGRETCTAHAFARTNNGWKWTGELDVTTPAASATFRSYSAPNYTLEVTCKPQAAIVDGRIVVGTFIRGEQGRDVRGGRMDVSPVEPTDDVAQGHLQIFEAGADGEFAETARFSSDGEQCTFPASIAGKGPRIAVGAAHCDDGKDHIRFYSLSSDSWTQGGRLTPDSEHLRRGMGGRPGFATDLAWNGETLAVGTRRSVGNTHARSSVVLYTSSGANDWTESQVIESDNSSWRQEFVAFRGDRLILEGPEESHVLERSGDTWTRIASRRPIRGGLDRRAPGVAVHGETIVVARYQPTPAPQSHHDGGILTRLLPTPALDVYQRTDGSWMRTAQLRLPEPALPHDVRMAVDMDDRHIVVGVKEATFVFTRTGQGWSKPVRLRTSKRESIRFGESVSIHDGVIAVGVSDAAMFTDAGRQSYVGAVHLFNGNGTQWTHAAEVRAPEPEAYAAFGRSVALYDGTLLVGESGNPGRRDRTGAAYIYKRSSGSWTHAATLEQPSADTQDRFGESVALRGDTAIVGASGNTAGRGLPHRGTALVYTRTSENTWRLSSVAGASPATSTERLGAHLAFTGTHLLMTTRPQRGSRERGVYAVPIRR